MKAIKTKYVSSTSNKPSRIRASAEGVPSKFYSTHQLIGITQTDRADKWHGLAAELFRDENKWTYHNGNPANGVQHLAPGQLDSDTWVHCFIPVEEEWQLKVAIVDEEANPPQVIKRVATIREAELYIVELEKTQPEKVHRGGFGIDA